MSGPTLYRGWIVLAAAFIVMLLGYAMRNTFTVFYPVIVQDFGWTRGSTAIMYSLTLVSYGFVAPVVGGLVDRFNPKFTLAAGSLIVGSGIALCSFATEVWHFYLLYGVMVAIGLSFIGVTPLSTIITNWFPKRRGFVFGLLGAGFGVSLVSAPVFQYLISSFGWQKAYVIIGAAATIIIMPLVLLFIRRMPTGEGSGTSAVDPRGSFAVGDSHPSAADIDSDWTARKALKTRTFRIFLTISFCNMGLAPQIVLAHEVYFLQDLGHTPMAAATVFGVFGAFFATGNVCSFLSDRFGRAPIFIGGGVLASAGVVLLILSQNSPSVTIAIVFAVCTGFGLGISPMTGYAAVADRFHGRHYGSIQGTMILAASLGGAIGPWIGGVLHDVTGNYQGALAIVIGVLLTGNLLMWLIRPGKGDVPV